MVIFDEVTNKYNECGVDNLFMSAKLCRYTYTHQKKINIHDVTRKSGRGLPSTIIHQELQSKAEQEKIRSTVIAAELVNDSKRPSLIAVSVYDTKPYHFFSLKAESMKW